MMRDWSDCGDGDLRLMTEGIIAVTRELSRQVPPPRGAPFFALESLDGDWSPLERFCARGIFRKYESVLDLDCGLGGGGRWWNAYFGCRLVGVAPTAAVASAAARLSDRSRAVETHFLAGSLKSLPCRSRRFTHVWWAEGLEDPSTAADGIGEAYRVLRPGGHLGVQQTGALASWSTEIAAQARAAGFTDIESHETRRSRLPESCLLARGQLLRWLRHAGERGAEWAAHLDEIHRLHDRRPPQIAQVFARRPPAGV